MLLSSLNSRIDSRYNDVVQQPVALTLSHTTNFTLFQIQRDCRRQFQSWWKWKKVLQAGRKHCGKRRNCSLRAISPFPTVFLKDFYCKHVKTRPCLGKGLKSILMRGGEEASKTGWKIYMLTFICHTLNYSNIMTCNSIWKRLLDTIKNKNWNCTGSVGFRWCSTKNSHWNQGWNKHYNFDWQARLTRTVIGWMNQGKCLLHIISIMKSVCYWISPHASPP